MARPLRVEFPGAMYHVIARGNAKQPIYLSDVDRIRFLFWLGRIAETHNIVVHAYCFMDNHYHLLIETPDANLSIAMRDLNGSYAQDFNVRRERVGHVFQGRYKSFVVEKESYLLEVGRYIALNPVRANLVSHAHKWKWSSFRATAGYSKAPSWLCLDDTLRLFSADRRSAVGAYRLFVQEGIGREDPHSQASHGFILGDSDFVYSIWEKTNGSEELKEYSRDERIVGRPSLKEIFTSVATMEERNSAIVFAMGRCAYLASEIAKEIKLDRSTIGKIFRKEQGQFPIPDLTPNLLDIEDSRFPT